MAWCGDLRVDHGQKHDPGDEIIIQRDLTNEGPLQKHYFGRSVIFGIPCGRMRDS